MDRSVVLVMLLAVMPCGLACSDKSAPEVADDDDDVPAPCVVDSALSCPAGSTGYTCQAGSNPEAEDTALACSDRKADDDNEGNFCCFAGFTGSSTTCQPDDDVSLACADGTFGFSCAVGDDPTTFAATLTCSDSSDTGTGESNFCCVYDSMGTGDDTGGGTAPSGCTADSTLECSGASFGYACSIGNNPEAEDSSLSCSAPNTDSDHEDDYCCFTGFTGSSTTCTPDDDVALACGTGYGFSCATGDDPSSYDASLTCSDSTDTEQGTSLYCCVYG